MKPVFILLCLALAGCDDECEGAAARSSEACIHRAPPTRTPVADAGSDAAVPVDAATDATN